MEAFTTKPYDQYIPCRKCNSIMRLSGCTSMGFVYNCDSCGAKTQRELYPERAFMSAICKNEKVCNGKEM